MTMNTLGATASSSLRLLGEDDLSHTLHYFALHTCQRKQQRELHAPCLYSPCVLLLDQSSTCFTLRIDRLV